MAQTQPRQNYHAECEAGVNKQINLELYASYVYQSMVSTILIDTVSHWELVPLLCASEREILFK